MLQGQPVCYASKALTDTERNYSNIERETLGVIWGLERFNYYIFGKHCSVNTDHKRLESVFKKRLSSYLPRLQRFLMRALKYDVPVNYVKGPGVPIAHVHPPHHTESPCNKATTDSCQDRGGFHC